VRAAGTGSDGPESDASLRVGRRVVVVVLVVDFDGDGQMDFGADS
jgi:hypothetical protein